MQQVDGPDWAIVLAIAGVIGALVRWIVGLGLNTTIDARIKAQLDKRMEKLETDVGGVRESVARIEGQLEILARGGPS